MRVHRIRYSTNVERVALALAHKGLQGEVEWVDHGPRERSGIRAVSGQDLVPVLEDGDLVIADSLAIIRHLEALRPDPPLWPRGPSRRAETEVFIEWFNEVWKGPPNQIDALRAQPEPDAQAIAALAARMRGWLDWFEALLDGREHLLGDAFGIADVMAFPFLKYATLHDAADDEPFHAILTEHLAPGEDFPRLQAWIGRVDARPRA